MSVTSRAKMSFVAAGVSAGLLLGALTAPAQMLVPRVPGAPLPAPQDPEADARAASPAASETPSPIAEAATRVIQRVGPAGEKRGLETLMTVSLRDADMAQSVRLLAEEAGVNVVLGQDVRGRVTCNLANVTARTAMEVILRANGYDFIGSGGVLVVVRQGQQAAFSARPQETALKIRRQIFYVPYTGNEMEFTVSTGTISGSGTGSSGSGAGGGSSGSVKTKTTEDLVRGMLSPVGKLAVYERGHMMVVEDDEANLGVIAQFIKDLWATPPQVFIDTKLIEVTMNEGEDLGLTWNAKTRVSDAGAKDASTGQPGSSPHGTTANTSGPSLFQGTTTFFSYGLVNSNVNIALQALATKEKLQVHSNPRVLVVNHRTATIVVGEEIPYLSSTQSQAGSAPINTYEFKEVAVRVEVTPHVADNGMIFMDVHPSVKTVIGYTESPKQPILSIREALTNVVMQDGTTLIIGGLAAANLSNKRYETPFLARIPLIGFFFRQYSDSKKKSDLLFLLSPKLLTPDLMKQLMTENDKLLEAPQIFKEAAPKAVDAKATAPEPKKR